MIQDLPVILSSLSVITILALSSWSSQCSCSSFRLEDFSMCSMWTRFFLSVVALRRFSAPSLIFSSFCIARRSSSFSPSSFCWKLGSIKFTPLPSCKRELPCSPRALSKRISERTLSNHFYNTAAIPSKDSTPSFHSEILKLIFSPICQEDKPTFQLQKTEHNFDLNMP